MEIQTKVQNCLYITFPNIFRGSFFNTFVSFPGSNWLITEIHDLMQFGADPDNNIVIIWVVKMFGLGSDVCSTECSSIYITWWAILCSEQHSENTCFTMIKQRVCIWLDERKKFELVWYQRSQQETVSIWESFSPRLFWKHECTQMEAQCVR